MLRHGDAIPSPQVWIMMLRVTAGLMPNVSDRPHLHYWKQKINPDNVKTTIHSFLKGYIRD
jgi:hypothetical protein